jgi:type VI protein secretion system component Hcp
MPNSVAEAYLLILRPTMVPVVGEAVPIPFNEQIELDEWDWTLENEETVEKALGKGSKGSKDDKSSSKKAFDQEAAKKLAAEVSKTQLDPNLSVEQKERKVRDLMNGLVRKVGADDRAAESDEKKGGADDDDDDEDDDNSKLKFTFKKNVDAATTQLLNSLKAGDLMPRAIVTLFHRSSNAPVTLAIKFENVRLKKYELSVEPSETMSDLKEEWTATYESVEYTYQNRPAASGPNGLTKGTVRVFKKKGGSLI